MPSRLGQAYLLSDDEKYARELVDQVNDWIDKNPYALGVTWLCAMDVALRAVNWIWGVALCTRSKHVSDEFLIRFVTSLAEHGQYIFKNLEGTPGKPSNGNHYLSNLVGLIYVGLMCPLLENSTSWLEFATKELWHEAEHQFLRDGMNFEGSTAYHRLSVELLISAVLLCQRNGIEIPESTRSTIRRGIEFCRTNSKTKWQRSNHWRC